MGFKEDYRAAVSGKTLWSIKELNSLIEGDTAPVGGTPLELWSWLRHVSEGPQKTEAKALIAKTYKDQEGLTGGMKANFMSVLAAKYADKTTLVDKDDVYRKLLGPADEAGSLLDLRNQYHSMTAAEQEAVHVALEEPLKEKWDEEWRSITFHNYWKGKQTYADAFKVIADIMEPGRSAGKTGSDPGAGKGKAQWEFFKELVDNADERLINEFTHKMAGELAHYV